VGAAEAASAIGGALPGGAQSSVGTTIRGTPIEPGDPITVQFSTGNGTVTVATAEVDEIRSSLGAVRVIGRGSLQRLGACRLSGTYEGQTVQQIVTDLADRAGVQTGDIAAGSTYPCVVVHESRSALRHVLDLASLEAMDVFDAPDGSLTVKPFDKTGADHVLRYGAELLNLHFEGRTDAGQVAVYGESPASAKGTDAWYWLVKDIAPYAAQAGDGAVSLAVQNGLARTKSSADSLAASLHDGLVRRTRVGHARLLGQPEVTLGDAIEIAEAPRPELNGVFKLTSVRHRFSRRSGFVTEIRFSDLGEAA
jgi:hypothetical protein